MKKDSQADIVYQYIKNLIVTRAIYPGTRIIENDIVQETGVSRTPVRSALMQLAYDGMIEFENNRGARVVKPSVQDFLQVYEVRSLLEVEAFQIALINRDDESIKKLRDSIEKQRAMEDQFNMVEYVSLNTEFHQIIVNQTKNDYLIKYLKELYNKVATYLLFWDTSATNKKSLIIHRKIFEAYRDQDLQKGIEAIREDIDLAIESVKSTQELK